MTPLIFVFIVAALFSVLVAAESKTAEAGAQLIQTGLFKWLVTGNWPAKVGAGLLLLGIGALLRYALVHVQVPPPIKLGSGLLIAAVLAAAAFALRARKERHAIYVALAGAAAGVAYLTAYSAYGFFGYVNEFNALAMLALVAVATGVFAVSANTMSIAILAMIGAYVAPAFALDSAGPGAVYGYYLVISALCLVMVALRGWRGLIHLSFLFTLAGALFFGWTAKFAVPQYYPIMQPLLLGLVVVHLAMPLVERRHLSTRWISRFDAVYFLLLPLVAALLTLLIAPTLVSQGALGLALLGVVWGATAGILKMLRRGEAFRHAIVAVLMLLGALLCTLDDVPWALFWLGLSVSALLVAPRAGWQKSTENVLCGAIVFFGLMHALTSLLEPASLVPFANGLFGKRLVGAALLGVAAFVANRRTLSLARVLIAIAAGWFLLALVDELRRLYLDFIPQLAYGLLLGLIALSATTRRWFMLPSVLAGSLLVALMLCGWWAVQDAGLVFGWSCLLLTPLVLLGLVLACTRADSDDGAASLALALLPVSMMPWAEMVFAGAGSKPLFMAMVFAIIGAVGSWWAASRWQPANKATQDTVLPTHFWLVALSLIWVTLVHIERSAPAVGFELAGLAYLVVFTAGRGTGGQKRSTNFGTVSVIASALVLQAMLLRVLGPQRSVMTIADLRTMALPAVVSLMWATLGAGLAWWGTRRASRSVWASGAALLVASAAKLVLLDFGSLGQLGNILALIAAGLVFLGVAWLAPVPPKRDPPADDRRPPPGRSSPPPPGPEPSPKPAAAAPLAARVQAAEGVNAVPNRVVFPSPPVPAQPATSMPNRAIFPAPPPLTQAQAVDDERHRINQAALALQARPNPAPVRASTTSRNWSSNPSSNGALKLVLLFGFLLVAAMVVVQLNGIRESYSHLPEVSNAVVQDQSAELAAAADAEARIAAGAKATAARAAFNAMNRDQVDATATRNNACDGFARGLNLPDHFSVFATGAYSSPSTGMRIDESGNYAGKIDVMVSHSRGPVVLMLGAYEPTIWDVSWPPETKVLAVLVSGYHEQQVTGLPSGTPVINSTYDNRGPCGYFYVTPDNMASIDPMALRVFKHGVNLVYPAKNGRAVIGDAAPRGVSLRALAATATTATYGNYAGPATREAEEGLEDLIQIGLLRKATVEDSRMFTDAMRAQGHPGHVSETTGPGDPLFTPPNNAYVVLGAFTYPAGLTGAHAGIFLIPKGVPKPRGNSGHSSAYDFN